MSSFKCEKCGKTCVDSNDGFISGCKHYPPEIRNDLFENSTKKESVEEKNMQGVDDEL